jgi:glycosyltransferase involved in cell wall biosynthesis
MDKIMSSRPKHLIYYDWYLDIRAGGPPGYLANLRYGLDRIDNPERFDLELWALKKPERNLSKKTSFLRKFTENNRALLFLAANIFSRSKKHYYKDYINFVENADNLSIQKEVTEKIEKQNIKMVHCHYVVDALKMINTLKKLNITGVKVMLTSHMPEAPALEQYNLIKEQGYAEKKALRFKKAWEHIQRRAFMEADILVFPSREAMEPYLDTIPEFSKWIENKDIRFIPTGAKQIDVGLTRNQAREKFSCDKKFVVSYLGRHIKVKGYDILKHAGMEILRQRNDVMFLIGGKESIEVAAPRHKNWREAGWVDPSEALAASDVFILPNRRTYFDLILLEAFSTGTPVIASNTGGNKSVQEQTGILSLYDGTKEDLVKKINEFLDSDEQTKNKRAHKTLEVYQKHYTPQIFAKGYLDLIEKIYEDYKIL